MIILYIIVIINFYTGIFKNYDLGKITIGKPRITKRGTEYIPYSFSDELLAETDGVNIYKPIDDNFTGKISDISSDNIITVSITECKNINLIDKQALVIGLLYNDKLDAKIYEWNSYDTKAFDEHMDFVKGRNDNIEYDESKSILEFSNNLVAKDKYRLDWDMIGQYKYVFYVNDWSCDYEYSSLLKTGSTILKVVGNNQHKLWYFDLLKPFKIMDLIKIIREKKSTNPDTSLSSIYKQLYKTANEMSDNTDHIEIPSNFNREDIVDIIDWCIGNNTICQKVSQNSIHFYKTFLSKNGIIHYWEYILKKLSNNVVGSSVIENKISKISIYDNQVVTKKIPILYNKKYLLIGENQYNISRIEMKTNTSISIVGENAFFKDDKIYEYIIINGIESDIVNAEKEINTILNLPDSIDINFDKNVVLLEFLKNDNIELLNISDILINSLNIDISKLNSSIIDSVKKYDIKFNDLMDIIFNYDNTLFMNDRKQDNIMVSRRLLNDLILENDDDIMDKKH